MMVTGAGVGSSPSSIKSSYFPFLSGNDNDPPRKSKTMGHLTKSFSGFSFAPSQHGSKGKQGYTTRTPSVASIESDYDYAYSRAARMNLRVLNPDPLDSSDEDDSVNSEQQRHVTTPIPSTSALKTKPSISQFQQGLHKQSTSRTPKPASPMLTTTSKPALVRRQSKTLDEHIAIHSGDTERLLLPPIDLTPFDSSLFMPPSTTPNDVFRLSLSPYFASSTTTNPAPCLSTPINALATTPAPTTTATVAANPLSRTPSTSESSYLDISSVPSPHQPQLSTSTTIHTDETSLSSLDFNSLSIPPDAIADPARGSATNPMLRALLERDASADNSHHSGSTQVSPQPTASVSSKYAKASYSLTKDPDGLLLYRDMAKKTGDKTVQYNYAKYLIEIAGLYDHGRETKHGAIASIKHSLEEAGQRLRHYDNKSHRRKKRLLEEEGIRWMKRLARERVPDAAFTMARWMDDMKYGFTRNPEKSFALYEVAAKAGIREATYRMALYYELAGDHQGALASLKKASDSGVVPATLKLAKVYLHGDLSQKQNMALALTLLHKAVLDADETCPEPPYMFGQILANTYPTIDIPRKVVEPYGGVLSSLPYFERAVQLGYAPARSTLGYILEHGLYGLGTNYAQAYLHYTEAAKKGDTRAMLGLSRLYNKGSHGPTDNDQASYQRRVTKDESGWLVQWEQDEELAFSWCRNAADQGLTEAEGLLGWYYEIGLGVVRDLEKAAWYYQKSHRKTDREQYQHMYHTDDRVATALGVATAASASSSSNHRRTPSSTNGNTLSPRKESQQCVSM